MRVHHLAFRTDSIETLARFYQHVVGLEPIGGQSGYSVWFRLGDAVLMVEQRGVDEPEIPPQSREFLGFSVTTVERDVLRTRLHENGVVVEEESEYTTYFRDPDGRRLGASHFDFSLGTLAIPPADE